MAGKRGPTIQRELLLQSREAALNAVQTFNNPLATLKVAEPKYLPMQVVALTQTEGYQNFRKHQHILLWKVLGML